MIRQWYERSVEEEREFDLLEVKSRPGLWAAVDRGKSFCYPETITWWQRQGCETDERDGAFVVRWPE